MPMPIVIKFEFEDESEDIQRIPAEIWKIEHKEVKKVFITEKEVRRIVLDPFLETADTDTYNNHFPRKQQLSRFELYKSRGRRGGENQGSFEELARKEKTRVERKRRQTETKGRGGSQKGRASEAKGR